MAVDPVQVVVTVAASAFGAALTAAIGLRYAIARFRKERAIDRRLTWHESTVRELVDASGKIIRALNASRSPHLRADQESAWRNAGEALGRLLNLETEAEMFASNVAYHALSEAAEDIRVTSKLAQRIAEQGSAGKEAQRSLQMYEITSKLLLHAASRLARDVREELQLDELSRDWRLYDDELASIFANLIVAAQVPATLRQP